MDRARRGWRGAGALALVATIVGVGVGGVGAPAVDAGAGTAPKAVHLDGRAAGAALVDRLVAAAGPDTVVARRDDGRVALIGAPAGRTLTADTDTDPGQVARAFVDGYGTLFGVRAPSRELAEARRTAGLDGRVTVRFAQSLSGVPVLGAQVAVTVDAHGAIPSATGEATAATGVDLVPSVTAADAGATALAFTVGEDAVAADQLVVDPPTLTVYDPSILDAADQNVVRLVWRVSVHTGARDVNRAVLVDAHDGTVAFQWSQVDTAKDRRVCDNNNVPSATNTCAGGNVRIEGSSPAVSGDATEVNDAYDFTGATYDFYFQRFGRDSLDDLGLPLQSIVNFCTNNGADHCPYPNAYWSGLPTNGGAGAMVFGDGFASALDVVGHELTHGVTEATSQLIYVGDSGAINESLSDVMGELIQRAAPASIGGSTTDDWQVGETLPAQSPTPFCAAFPTTGTIRSMKDPTLCNQPDRTSSNKWYIGSSDNFGVHENSGVGNKAAYLITDGGTFNGQTIAGIGLDKAALVYYELMTTQLGEASDYRDLAAMLPQACENLVGTHGVTLSDCAQVRKAVTATEMATLPTGGSAARPDAPACEAGSVPSATIFSEDFTGPLNADWDAATTGAAQWVRAPDFQGQGSAAAFAEGVSTTSDTTLTLKNELTLPPNGSASQYISFRHWYGFEFQGSNYFDGGVLEYSTDSGSSWSAAEGSLTSVNGGLHGVYSGDTNPIKGRIAFTGVSRRAETSRYLLNTLAGQQHVKFRFRMGTDSSFASYGWAIENVQIYDCLTAVTPTGAPGVPSGDQSDGEVLLDWTAPAAGGAQTPTSYVITPYVAGVAQTPVETPTAATSYALGGLTNGTAFTFTVAAKNPAGPGPSSAQSEAFTPGPPSVPIAIVATGGTGQAGLTWQSTWPASGSPITGYSVTPVKDGVAQAPVDVTGAVAGATVTGLANGSTYTFQVRAVNAVGAGPAGTSNPVVTGLPGAPTAVIASVEDSASSVSWTAPASIGGSAILAYRITPRIGGVAQTPVVTPTSATSFDVTGLTNGISYTFTVAAVNASGTGAESAPSAAVTPAVAPKISSFTALTPTRLFDTRPTEAQGVVSVTKQRYGGVGNILRVKVTGVAGVPDSSVVGAVSLNVTAIDPLGGGFVTVFPCGDRPLAANLNYVAGQIVPNAVIAPVSAAGEVCFYSLADVHLVADVNGWFASGAGFAGVTPTRLFDTRPTEAQGVVSVTKQRYGGVGNILRVKVTGVAGVPDSSVVGAVSLNVTAIDPLGGGFVTVFPCGDRPLAANLNYVAGQIVPNAVIAPVSAAGEVCFYSLADVHLVADVNGWFASGAGFAGVTPTRLFDTRPTEAQGVVSVTKQRYGGVGNILRVKVTGVAGVPDSSVVGAVSLNVTAIDPLGGGFVTVFPCGDRPLAANLNYVAGQIVPNAVIAPVSAAGEVCFYSLADVHLVADVNGWFATSG